MINLFTYLLRQLFATIDGLIYWAGAELYDLMIAIAEAKVFENTTILTVAGRVYQLLGLIMLFKMIFSFLMYVINPDELMDKKKGVGNIIKRIIITLVLIVITPWAFEQSRNLQIYVIDDKVIEYFVFGQSKPSNASAGYNLMYITGKSFVAPYKCVDGNCADTEQDSVVCGSDWDEHLPNLNKDGTFSIAGAYSSICAYGAGSNKDFAKDLYAATTLDENGHYDLRALMRIGAATEDDFLEALNGARAFAEYQILWSTLVGIFICYMLLVMCIDMAVRSVKLAFYEIIAPIPIVSYVGFKEGKDSMLNKWFSQCLKTYADLFTRIAGLQIAVFFIDEIADTGFAKNDLFVNIFLILGALTFAKELPKILEGMGVKFGGGGGFNLKKKFTDNMLGSKRILNTASRAGAAGLALAGGMTANAMRKASNAYKRGKDAEWQAAKAAGFRAKRDYKKINHDKFGSSIIAGGFSSAYRAATSKDGKLFSGAASGIKGSVDARDLRDKRKDADYGFVTRKLDEMRDFAGIDTAAKGRANELHDRINQMNAVLGTYQSQLNSYATQLSSTQINDIMKNPDNYLSDADVNISGYASMLKAYSKQQTAITKEQKKLEKLYESSKK